MYDAAGNRDSMTVNSATTTYTYNALDQLKTAGTVTYDYDGRGNQIKITNGSNITNYTYNAADQLTSVSATGVNASYGYDADGKRVKQTVGSAVTNYLWDEASAYGDVVYEYNGSGSTLASYVLGGTGLISQNRSGVTNYYLQDGQGSTRALTSTTGTVTDTYSYTAFGESFATTGTTVNPYRYTGQQFDTSTGLYSLRARYYNPALGRFLSGDTYPVNFGNPIEFNRYVYTGNNPINAMDPSGHLLVELNIQIAKIGAAATVVYSLGTRAYTMLAYYVSQLAPYSADDIMSFLSIVQFADTLLESGGGGRWGGGGGGGGGDEDSDEIDPEDALSPQARFLLKKLPYSGATFTFPNGPIDLETLLYAMSELQEFVDTEFILVRVRSGDIVIIRGVPASEQGAFSYAPPDTVNIIAHTHPDVLTNIPGRLDFVALRDLGQDSSIIVTLNGGPRTFYLKDDYWMNP